jgi:hypothetical protein
MPSISVLDTGRLDERDSCYAQAVQLPCGDILCAFSVGGGPNMHGGTEWARSTNGGKTWQLEGTILPPTQNPRSSNALKLTLSSDGKTIYAYGARLFREIGEKFGGAGQREAVICASVDSGRSWSAVEKVPISVDYPLEVSHGVLPLSSGRLLAPASTLPARDRLGEQALVAISDDGGKHWPMHSVVFEDREKKHGYLEQKLAEISPGRVIATAWTVTLGDVHDRPNSFTISNDYGSTWNPVCSTGIQGQTLTPLPLGGDRLLVLYNRRHSHQGIVMGLVTFTEDTWIVHHEELLYDAEPFKSKSDQDRKGLASFDTFHFGFPIPILLQDKTAFATYWCRENGHAEVRWEKLLIEW